MTYSKDELDAMTDKAADLVRGFNLHETGVKCAETIARMMSVQFPDVAELPRILIACSQMIAVLAEKGHSSVIVNVVGRAGVTLQDVAASSAAWSCSMYGDDAEVIQVGALCFRAPRYQRLCATPDQCRATLDSERNRIHDLIKTMAEAGSPVGEYLLTEFPTPDTLLGGGDEPG